MAGPPSEVHQLTTSCGRFVAASSLLKITSAFCCVGFFRTSVTMLRPAAFSAFRKLVTSSSYQVCVVPVTVAVDSALPTVAGLLFHVSPVSDHVVLDDPNACVCTPTVDASPSAPNRRSLPLLIAATELRSNLR